MGCVFCNITRAPYFGTEDKPEPNPFFCKTSHEEDAFLDELANDIAMMHPEFVEKINKLVAEKEVQDEPHS